MAAELNNLELLKKKDEIEKEISDMFQILESNDKVGMDGPLVDREGYPRSDIDVYAVRQARNKVICLRNDHKQLMKRIEERIHEVHADAREQGTVSSAGTSSHSVNGNSRQPFATITTVTPTSPAAIAGLCVGDGVVEFGSVNEGNFSGMQDIGSVVQHSEGKPVRLVLVRNTNKETVSISITPRKWSGRGLLGCTIVPIARH